VSQGPGRNLMAPFSAELLSIKKYVCSRICSNPRNVIK